MGEPGPAYIEFPTDFLRCPVPSRLVLDDWLKPKPARRLPPDPVLIEKAVSAIRAANRPLVVPERAIQLDIETQHDAPQTQPGNE